MDEVRKKGEKEGRKVGGREGGRKRTLLGQRAGGSLSGALINGGPDKAFFEPPPLPLSYLYPTD